MPSSRHLYSCGHAGTFNDRPSHAPSIWSRIKAATGIKNQQPNEVCPICGHNFNKHRLAPPAKGFNETLAVLRNPGSIERIETLKALLEEYATASLPIDADRIPEMSVAHKQDTLAVLAKLDDSTPYWAREHGHHKLENEELSPYKYGPNNCEICKEIWWKKRMDSEELEIQPYVDEDEDDLSDSTDSEVDDDEEEYLVLGQCQHQESNTFTSGSELQYLSATVYKAPATVYKAETLKYFNDVDLFTDFDYDVEIDGQRIIEELTTTEHDQEMYRTQEVRAEALAVLEGGRRLTDDLASVQQISENQGFPGHVTNGGSEDLQTSSTIPMIFPSPPSSSPIENCQGQERSTSGVASSLEHRLLRNEVMDRLESQDAYQIVSPSHNQPTEPVKDPTKDSEIWSFDKSYFSDDSDNSESDGADPLDLRAELEDGHDHHGPNDAHNQATLNNFDSFDFGFDPNPVPPQYPSWGHLASHIKDNSEGYATSESNTRHHLRRGAIAVPLADFQTNIPYNSVNPGDIPLPESPSEEDLIIDYYADTIPDINSQSSEGKEILERFKAYLSLPPETTVIDILRMDIENKTFVSLARNMIQRPKSFIGNAGGPDIYIRSDPADSQARADMWREVNRLSVTHEEEDLAGINSVDKTQDDKENIEPRSPPGSDKSGPQRDLPARRHSGSGRKISLSSLRYELVVKE